ncbi:hypothetical protein BH20ACT4_BH20ACT4_12660 [soil metagenome]
MRADERLVETDAGPWQGLTHHEIRDQWPGYLDDHRRPDGFEPLEHVVERAVGVLADIAVEDIAVKDIAVKDGAGWPLAITHAGVIRTLIRGTGLADAAVPNLTGWLFDVTGGGDVLPVAAFDPDAATIDRRSTTPTLG